MSALLAITAAIAGTGRLGLLAALHVAARGRLDPVRDAVSDYANGATRRLAAVMTWLTVVAWIALAAAVWIGEPDWSDRVPATVMLVVLAIVFAALPFAPTDEQGERTTRGRVHMLLAVAWFAVSYSLTGDMSRLALERWGWLGPIESTLHWIALVGLVALVACLVLPRLRRWFGLAERVFIVAISLFYVVASLGILVG